MEGACIIFHPWASQGVLETHIFKKPPDLDYIKGVIGGWLEYVSGFNTIEIEDDVFHCVAYCNEEGKLQGQDINVAATHAWDKALRRGDMHPNGILGSDGNPIDVLVGSVIVLFGDEEFMAAL